MNRLTLSLELLDRGLVDVGGNTPWFVLPNDRPTIHAIVNQAGWLIDFVNSTRALRCPRIVLACELKCSPLVARQARYRLARKAYTEDRGVEPCDQASALSAGLVESTAWPEGWSVEECACSIGVLPRAFAAELRRLAG
jgi:hypothetical protein